MGSVLTPSYAGIEKTLDLPQASTLCGECHVVCPVKIPLPDLLRKLREKQVERHLRPPLERLGLTVWAYLAKRPTLYRWATSAGVRFLRALGGAKKSISRLPFADGWTNYREMPAPPGKTFRELYRQRRKNAK
jgi:L-lactate dehydrogenase complex protein LldF